MTERTQIEIVQDIVDSALSRIQNGWLELVVNYCVEGGQSNFQNSFLIDVDGRRTEKYLPSTDQLDTLMRELRDHLAQADREKFSKCRIHLGADGRFDASYGYDAVDWDSLFKAKGNFA